MRIEKKYRPHKMSSVLGTCLPPPRIYHKNGKDVRPATHITTSDADCFNSKQPCPCPSPAVDSLAVESSVVEQSAPDIVHCKGDASVEETPSASPPVEDTTCTDLNPPTTAELSSRDDNVDTLGALLPLPEKVKKMAFVNPVKPKIPHYKSYKQPREKHPPPQTVSEELPRGVYVPPASSPYPSLDNDEETPMVAEPEKSDEETEVYPNPFKSSCSVLRLSGGLFEEFLKQMDVVLVMFYKGALSQQGSKESWAKDQFVKASEMTSRTNHAFAAVDCTKENQTCNRQDVTSFPLFRLYSKGHMVDTIKNYQSFDSETMQKFVEFSPVLDQQPRTDSLFSRITRSSRAAQAAD